MIVKSRRVLNDWRSVIVMLNAYGIPASRIQIQPALARNWDYYTGIVFELWSGEGHHIGGGGRYDELAHLVGGQRDVPAVGFAYYVEQLLEALPELQPEVHDSIMIFASKDNFPNAILWAQRLRSLGRAVVLYESSMASNDETLFVIQPDGSLARNNQNYLTIESLIDTLEAMR